MSSNEFGKETHWVLARSNPSGDDQRKQWHIRCISNYRVIVYSPQYRRKIDALRAGQIAAPEWFASKTPLEVDERGQRNEHSRPASRKADPAGWDDYDGNPE